MHVRHLILEISEEEPSISRLSFQNYQVYPINWKAELKEWLLAMFNWQKLPL